MFDSPRVYRMSSRAGAAIALALALLICTPATRPAQAGKSDQVNMAVDLFVYAGQFAGIPLAPEHVAFARTFVRCLAEGSPATQCGKESVVAVLLKNTPGVAQDLVNCVTDGKPIAACGADAALSQVPEQARPMARCLVEGGDPVACGKKFVVDSVLEQVPEKARGITECIIGGGDVQKCAKEEALRQIPNQDARAVAGCVLDGTPVDQCGSQALIKSLPKEVQAVVGCMASKGNVVDCAKQMAIDQLPDGKPKQFATCMNTPGKTPEQCAAQFGIGVLDPATKQAAQEALAAAAKVQEATADAMSKMPNLVKNIMTVARGIREERWDLIIEGGGPELAKLAGNILIQVILTPAIVPIAGPVIDAMIQAKADAFFGLLKAINDGDAIRVAAIIFEYYARMAIDIPCSLVPDGDFKDAVCGNLGKAISKAVELGSAALKDILEIGEDIAKFIGVYDIGEELVDIVGQGWKKVKDIIGGIFGGDDKPTVTCIGMSPQQFYAQNYLACLSTRMDTIGPVQAACVSTMQTCGIKNPDQLCTTMQSTFNAFRDRIRNTYPQGADNFTAQSFGAFAQAKGEAVCEEGYWEGPAEIEFASACAATIESQAHVADNNCPMGAPRPHSRAAFSACRAALKRFDKEKPTWNMCAGYRERKAEFDAKIRPCAEANLQVGHAAGNPYVDVKRPFDLRKCYWGDLDAFRWPVDTRMRLPDILVRPAFDIFDPGFVIRASAYGQTNGANDFLPSGFAVGGCNPGVPVMSPATSSRPGSFRIKWDIIIPKSEVRNCTFSGGGAYLASRSPAVEVLRRPVLTAPPSAATTKLKPSVATRPKPSGGGTGGAYLVYPNDGPPKTSSNALNRLDAISGSRGLNAVGGGGVGFVGGGRPQPCPACAPAASGSARSGTGTTANKPSAPVPSGGTGGAYKVYPSGPDRNPNYGAVSQPKFREPR